MLSIAPAMLQGLQMAHCQHCQQFILDKLGQSNLCIHEGKCSKLQKTGGTFCTFLNGNKKGEVGWPGCGRETPAGTRLPLWVCFNLKLSKGGC